MTYIYVLHRLNWTVSCYLTGQGVDEWFMMMERSDGKTYAGLGRSPYIRVSVRLFSCGCRWWRQKTQCAQLHKRARKLEGAVLSLSGRFFFFFSRYAQHTQHSRAFHGFGCWYGDCIAISYYRSMWYPFRPVFFFFLELFSFLWIFFFTHNHTFWWQQVKNPIKPPRLRSGDSAKPPSYVLSTRTNKWVSSLIIVSTQNNNNTRNFWFVNSFFFLVSYKCYTQSDCVIRWNFFFSFSIFKFIKFFF